MKNLKYIFLLALSVLLFNRCEDDVLGTKDINYISFEVNSPTLVVEEGSSAQMDVKVYTTQKSGSDRTFSVDVISESTTANTESYNVPSTVTVPANSNVGTLTVTASDNNLGVDPVSLALEVGKTEGLFTGNTASVTILKHCPLDINDFVGTFSGDTHWGPTQIVTTLENNTLYITGVGVAFLTGYWGEEILSMEKIPVTVDQETGDFTIDQAAYVVTIYDGNEQAPYFLSGYGNLNACTGTMYLYYDFYQEGIGSYVDYWGGDQSVFTEIVSIQ